ncbi:MAG TPA: BadF/BadG/BcrA/BcrD ATPase family protein [Burkholderiaceae bacterium]|nr:BadF/BadG/BcrA/BcrD ATPase family protein [Burkholderiaceae bacterium]
MAAEIVEFLLGVDGGGTGTRVLLARREDAVVIGRGTAGPSGLARGIASAWEQIGQAAALAFADAGLPAVVPWRACALGAGLAGVNHRPWAVAFVNADPGLARLELETDAFTMLLGAHAGQPGAIVASGTGSVGEVWHADGRRASVGGWGFPIGDEGSGAWLGFRAMQHAQHAVDGRAAATALAQAVWSRCGRDRDALLTWCAQANQFEYAQLAPLVFEAEAAGDAVASGLLEAAAAAIEAMTHALDPDGRVPLAISGSVGERLAPRLSATLRARQVAVAAGADVGALKLIQRAVQAVSP